MLSNENAYPFPFVRALRNEKAYPFPFVRALRGLHYPTASTRIVPSGSTGVKSSPRYGNPVAVTRSTLGCVRRAVITLPVRSLIYPPLT
jgi:hypothetical protein